MMNRDYRLIEGVIKPPPKKLTPPTNLGEVQNGKNQGPKEGQSVQ